MSWIVILMRRGMMICWVLISRWRVMSTCLYNSHLLYQVEKPSSINVVLCSCLI